MPMETEEEEARKTLVAASRRGRRSSRSSPSSSTASSSRLPAVVEEEEEEPNSSSSPSQPPLCVFDFDHTLVDFDSAEEVVSQLAPELAPMLTSLTMPANFIPLTNAVAAEAGRRGVREGHWLAALAETGRRGLLGGGASAAAAAARGMKNGAVGGGGAGVLRAAAAGGAEVRILSDANDLFIGTMLRAAGLGAGVVSGVVTNRAKFVAVPAAHPRSSSTASRLVVEPRHDAFELGPHGCGLCPTNLCKGLELRRLLVGGEGGGSGEESRSPSAEARRRVGVSSSPSSSGSRPSSSRRHRRTVLYAGDGENDLCPALCLKRGDSLLVRRGRGLERLLRERAEAASMAETQRQRRSSSSLFQQQHPSLARAFDASLSSALAEGALAFVWDSVEELRALVEALLLCEEKAGELLLSDL